MDETKPKKKRGGVREKFLVDEVLSRQIASLIASRYSVADIAKELNISWDTAKKISQSEAVRGFCKEIGEASILAAKSRIRHEVSQLADDILGVIRQKLQEGDLDAVKVGLKIIGFENQEPVAQAQTSLTVILPGAEGTKKTIEVEHEDH